MDFVKREFVSTYYRETADGQKLYLVTDKDEDTVYTFTLIEEEAARVTLNLVQQAYEAGIRDMQEHICKSMGMQKSHFGGYR